jgi:TRAP transporter 4TM/12TM fusion protein
MTQSLAWLRTALGASWFVAQIYILFHPPIPMLARPLHVMIAVVLIFLWQPLVDRDGKTTPLRAAFDLALLAGCIAATVYYWLRADYLTERMENVDPVFQSDLLFGLLTLFLLCEATRRVLGWNLLSVIVVFVLYGFAGPYLPSWMHFAGFKIPEFVEIMTMTGHGIFGITTETSLTLVFYFLAFSAVYAAAGGTELFMDLALKLVGKRNGGAAKAEVVSSALFGTVSGSAVANVTATGSFTIPLMIRTGYSREWAAAHEAIASTGGQLMPPVMGIAAFVMADIVGVPYAKIALAATIPALAYFGSLYLLVHLNALRSGIGSLPVAEIDAIAPVLRRILLIAPPLALIGAFAIGYDAAMAAVIGGIVAWACSYLPGGKPLTPRRFFEMTDDCARQAAAVAIPIAAIGIIIGVAVQSNLAIKFSTEMLALGGGTLAGSLVFISLGIIVLGMGLPTVAAYVIGAILFVPALQKLGVDLMASHFYVLFFAVLSMVTPPVALASYTAAGIARSNPNTTGLYAFLLATPTFLVPIAFVRDPAILFIGPWSGIALAAVTLGCGAAAWTIMVSGYAGGVLNVIERVLFGVLAVVLILAPFGTIGKFISVGLFAVLLGWAMRARFLNPSKSVAAGEGGS